MRTSIAAAAGLAAALGGSVALAQSPVAQGTYSFSYKLDNGNIDSGVFTGTLESDHNTFDISGIQSFSLNGATYNGDLDASNNSGSSSFKGAKLDRSLVSFEIDGDNSSETFALCVNDACAREDVGYNAAFATTGFGGSGSAEAFVPASYTASYTPSGGGGGGGGPEPSTWALMMLGVFGVGMALRRRQGGSTALA